jgi:ribonuclease BN (tRNA processing enzyme)
MVFVGSGGGAHGTRCHAAIAVGVAPQRVLLLDTAGGFEVVAGLKRAEIDLLAVTRIFLSHRHSDHLLGLEPLLLHIGLDAMWSRRRAGEVRIFGEPRVLAAAQAILDAVASSAPQLIADAGGQVVWVPVAAQRTVAAWPDVALTPFAADHVPDDGTSLGCSVDLDGALFGPGVRETPYRLAYSADSRPAAALVCAAAGADVLIHEAGGLDAHQAQVSRAGHSTAGEAGRQATAAGAGRLFLFHVPNDGLVPDLLREARGAFSGPVEVAEDGQAHSLLQPVQPAVPRARDAAAPVVRTGRRRTPVRASEASPPSPSPAG